MIDKKTILERWPTDQMGPMLGNATEKRDLGTEDILALIRAGPVRFIVAILEVH